MISKINTMILFTIRHDKSYLGCGIKSPSFTLGLWESTFFVRHLLQTLALQQDSRHFEFWNASHQNKTKRGKHKSREWKICFFWDLSFVLKPSLSVKGEIGFRFDFSKPNSAWTFYALEHRVCLSWS